MLLPQLPDYGCFPRWPESGQGWIHPDDVATVTRLIPSERVMRRESYDGTYYHYRYGSVQFRLRPCLWLRVKSEGFDLGDPVETLGIGFERERFVAMICGMYFVRRKGRVLYRLKRSGTLMPQLYIADHLRLLADKARVRTGDLEHPAPRWDERSESGQRLNLDG